MEEEEEDRNRSSSECYSCEANEKASCVLQRGLRLGKKILMAGFLASSAPLVLPPLLVFSVIGISVSMPYGLFLASHACTEKLMSKLLPMPTAPNVAEPEKKLHENEDINASVEQYIPEEEKASPEVNVVTTPEVKVVTTLEGPNDRIGDNTEECEVTDVVAVEESGDDIIEEGELEKETKGLLEKIRDEGRCKTRDQVGSANANVERDRQVREHTEVDDGNSTVENTADAGEIDDERSIEPEDNTHTIDLHKEVIEVVAVEEFGDDTLEGGELEKETKGLLEKIRDGGRNDARDQVGAVNANLEHDPQVGEHIEEVDDGNSRVENTADAREVDDEASVEPEDYTYTIDLHEETSYAMELSVSSVPQESTQPDDSSAKDMMSPSDEVMQNEEKIWKEINAIRLIVGYKGTPQASCVDELKNLYMFTGVEPPTVLNDSCNLLEINDKLHFLMSILGVKSSLS